MRAAMIRVASYNMRKAIGTDRRRDPQRVLDVLHEIDADVVALQEADRRVGGRASALRPDLRVEPAFLELSKPSFQTTVDKLVRAGFDPGLGARRGTWRRSCAGPAGCPR